MIRVDPCAHLDLFTRLSPEHGDEQPPFLLVSKATIEMSGKSRAYGADHAKVPCFPNLLRF